MNLKKFIRSGSIIAAAALTAVSMTSCSLLGTKEPEPAPTSAAQVQLTPEEAIIGYWEITSLTDPNGNEVEASDIDLSGTPLESISAAADMILRQGVTLEFKDDKTVSLSFLSGDYEINSDTLTLSMPELSQSVSLPCTIDGSQMTLSIKSYSISLTKK